MQYEQEKREADVTGVRGGMLGKSTTTQDSGVPSPTVLDID